MKTEIFRQDFKRIVWLKGQLSKRNNYIKQLSRYDKNGSHQNAILKAIKLRDEVKETLDVLLMGKTYDEWKDASAELSKLISQLKRINKKKSVIEDKINKYIIQ